MPARHKTLLASMLLPALLVVGGAQAEDPAPILDTNITAHLEQALHDLNMNVGDLGFSKDHGEPLLVMESIRPILEDPLKLGNLADRVGAAARSDNAAGIWALSRALYEVEPVAPDPDPAESLPGDASLPVSLQAPLKEFFEHAQIATRHLASALSGLSPSRMEATAAGLFEGIFDSDANPEVRARLLALGISTTALDSAIAEMDALDPEPAATNELVTLQAIDYASLLAAAEVLHQAVLTLAVGAQECDQWPDAPIQIDTEFGAIFVGTPADDCYDSAALLILDPNGNDEYRGAAAVANGLGGQGVACVLDLAGNDRYLHAGILGAGSALFGACVVFDLSGNDIYRAEFAGLGAGYYGVSWQEDRAGEDTYTAAALCEGAGSAGMGVLRDLAGDDIYKAGKYGQGFSSVYALGWLIDHAGSDRYLSGGSQHDYGRRGDRFLTLSQGFSIGARPYFGGGVGALIDFQGSDYYQADMYGQGSAYWYAVGLLLDFGGGDKYDAYQYSQGSGIHLAAGLLYDESGNDRYTGWDICQGSSHDYAVGMLIDRAGDDTYTANDSSHGRGIHNSFGLLADCSGRDSYMGRNAHSCQGVGHHGGDREYGSIAVLLDLGGPDFYTSGAKDGARFLRPFYGIVYDVE